MQAEALSALLCHVFDPTCPGNQKQHAEQLLQAFSNSVEGLEWALTCVQSSNADPQHQFFAASVLEGAVARRWNRLPSAHQATLQNVLWVHATQQSTYLLPQFVTSKLRAALAQLACINWQLQFWTDLQACLNNPTTEEASVRLLGATLEQLHSMAQGTTSELSGKVLSSDLPIMQSRRQEAQNISFQMLCHFLQHLLSNSNNPAAAAPPLSVTIATLDALRVAITTSNVEIFCTQSSSVPETELGLQITSLLLPFISLAATDSAAPARQNTNQLVILAMSCLEDLVNRPHQPHLKQKMIIIVLPALSALCLSWSGAAAALNSDLVGVFTRLLTQTLQHSLSFAVSNPEIGAGVQEVLREITNFAAATAGASSSSGGGNGGGVNSLLVGVLAASEAWHAVLTYMEDLEASNWNENDSFDTTTAALDDGGGNTNISNPAEKQLLSFYKQGVLHFSNLLLSIFFTGSTQIHPNQGTNLPSPPFLIQHLDTSTGSGAALEDWVAAVGDSSEDFQTDAKDDASNDEDEKDLSSSSEAHVFAQQAEYFIAHATSSYATDLVSVLFRQLGPAMTAAAQARQQSDLGLLYLCNFKAVFALTSVSRCAPLLPTTGLTVPVVSGNEEGASLSGGHVLQLIQALLQFGNEQLKIVRSEAEHAQHHMVSSVLDTLVAIYRTVSPFMTAWLPQIMLTKAGDDSDVQILISQLLQAVVEFVAAGVECSVAVLNSHSISSRVSTGAKKLALAASQTLLSVTSISLSSAMKPPVPLLQTITNASALGSLEAMVAAAVHGQNDLSRAALRSLIVSLSDLALRSWGTALQTSAAEINDRKAALASLTAPLLQIINQSAAQVQIILDHQVCLVGSLATDIVESYLGSPKVVRAAIFEVFSQPMLVAVMEILKNLKNSNTNPKMGTTLLGFISSCLRAFPAELGTSSIGELLSALVAAFSTMNSTIDPGATQTSVKDMCCSFDADVVLLSIITSALNQGGSKHASLVLPAIQFGLQILNRSAVQSSSTHITSEVLTSLLSIMSQHWRTVGGGLGTAASNDGGGGGDGIAIATLTHVSSFLSDAASTRAIPSASEVNSVLETLIDIQAQSKLFWKPYFSGWKDLTMESILKMLLTRMYTGAQETLIDVLYQLATANYSYFLLQFLPAFAETMPRGAELAAALGTGDMESWAFQKAIIAFVNDAIYWEKRL